MIWQVIEWLSQYLVPSFLCALWLIKEWRIEHGGDHGLEDGIMRILLYSLAWPVVMFVSVFPWQVFSWKFWLQPVRLPLISIVVKRPWWWRR